MKRRELIDRVREDGVDRETVRDDFLALRERYRARLAAQIDTLEAYLREKRLEEALALAHRLKGTAGSYGLDQASSALERIEMALRENAADEVPEAVFEALASARGGVC